MSNEDKYLMRSNNRRRKTKEKEVNSFANRLVNILIIVVAVLIMISITLILTNSDLKSNIKKPDEQSSTVITEENEQGNNDSSNEEQQEDGSDTESDSEQQEGNQNTDPGESEENNGQVEEGENNATDGESSGIEEEMQFITTVATEDPNVIVAFVDSRWTPYPTAQTGAHYNAFEVNHIDYQEKLKLLYRDTGFTEDTSILWSIRNKSGDTVAVISAKNKTNIFRLTMKWINGQGWQTVLVEQLNSLEGAY